jgi:hypothetical protein
MQNIKFSKLIQKKPNVEYEVFKINLKKTQM